MIQQFILFAVLQVLDLITTLYIIEHGGAEANPIVLQLVQLAPSFKFGLYLIKIWALGTGYWLYRRGGYGYLLVTNSIFSLVVLWNLMGILLSWVGH